MVVKVKSCFTQNNVISIHYLDSTQNQSDLTPLVYVPGILGNAEQFSDEMEVFSSRRTLSLSLRGRGKSDAPKKGYSVADHAADIHAVIEDSQITNFCLLAHSMGVPYAIKYAIQNQDQMKGFIICDYPASYPLLPKGWEEEVISKGLVPIEREHVIRELRNDSKDIQLWDDLQ